MLAGQDSAVAALLQLAEGSGGAERLVTYEDSDGATALILACTLGHYRIAQHLLLHAPERQVRATGGWLLQQLLRSPSSLDLLSGAAALLPYQ